MTRLSLVLSLSLITLSELPAQEGNSLPLPELLKAENLPEGYQATTKVLKAGDKNLGHMIVVGKPSQFSKVVIRIETRDLTAVPARRAAAKAYVNGFASSLADAGYKIIEKKIPDIAKESFARPIAVDLVFASDDGKKLWTHQEIFFTDKGFSVQVIAEDSDTLASLTKWAKTIEPKVAPK